MSSDPNAASRLLNSDRIDPADYADHPVYMAPSQTDASKHAEHRLNRQMRLMGVICMLRMKGELKKGAKAGLGETIFQHGQGGTGEQAAHKLLLTVSIDGVALEKSVRDKAAEFYIIYLSSETSIIDRVYNEADAAIENEGGRAHLLVLIQKILDGDYPDSYGAFKTAMVNIWNDFRKIYQTAAQTAMFQLGEKEKDEKKNYLARLELQKKNSRFPQKQIDDAFRRWKAFEKQREVTEFYAKIADSIKFPLSEGELKNLYEAVMDKPAKE